MFFEQKYEFTEEEMVHGELTFHRIRALRDFGDVQKGDVGGWIEAARNLSHDEDCWVYDEARVFGQARLYEDATVRHTARVYGEASVCGRAKVYESATVCERARVHGKALVGGEVYVSGMGEVEGRAMLGDDARVYGYATVRGNTRMCGTSEVGRSAVVDGDILLQDNAAITGEGYFQGSFHLGEGALIERMSEVLIISPVGAYDATLIAYLSANDIIVTRGCFTGTIKEFRQAVRKERRGTRHYKEYLSLVKYIERRLGTSLKLRKKRWKARGMYE